MTEEERKKANALIESWRSEAMDDIVEEMTPDFCADFAELSMHNAFASVWVREGLDLRARSLVTLGILIAQQAHDSLMVHIPIALKNGCTVRELEEVIYHSTVYAGYPAANVARRAALKTLSREKAI